MASQPTITETEGLFALKDGGWEGGYSHRNRELRGRISAPTFPPRMKGYTGGLSEPGKWCQLFLCGASARPGSALGWGLGLCAIFVLTVPRHRDHWPFLAWALRASGNSSRTIISGGMCSSSILPESQAVSLKMRNVPLWPLQLQGISRTSGGHRGLRRQKGLGALSGRVVLSLDAGFSGPRLESGQPSDSKRRGT